MVIGMKNLSFKNNENSAISYSMPLILPDGTVYGVVGVELLTSYLENLMPIDELKMIIKEAMSFL